MANAPLRIAGLADALAAVLPDVEARLARDGLSDGDRRLMEALRWCAIEAEQEVGLTTYALALFRADPRKRRLREMRADLETVGVLKRPHCAGPRVVTRVLLRAA